jgi:hypothetical protein
MLSEDLLKITYKGQDYTLKQLIQDNNDFMKSLAIPEALNLPPADLKFTSLGDFGYLIARDKFRHLYGLLATARFAASEAHKKLHKGPVLWSSGYTGQMWVRSQYLKNAVLWYNSCDDYLLQIIWFAFDFVNPNKLRSPNIYKRALRGCRWESLLAKLEYRNMETDVAFLLKEIKSLRTDVHVKSVRDIANSLKHHADIYIKDLDLPPDYILTSDQGFNSAAVADKPLDLDDAAILLQRAHQKITEFATFLLHFIDFEAPFADDEPDLIHMDKFRDKLVYKKFSICS